jgi:hypothetical protein
VSRVDGEEFRRQLGLTGDDHEARAELAAHFLEMTLEELVQAQGRIEELEAEVDSLHYEVMDLMERE